MDEIQQDAPVTKGRRVVVDPAVSSDAPSGESSAPKRRTRSAKPKTEGDSAPAEAPTSENTESRSEGSEPRSQGNRENNGDRSERQERSERNDQGDDRNGRNNRNRNRNRDRNRNRGRTGRGGDFQDEAEPEISEDDVLISVAGILDVLENYAFIRTSGYLPGPNDVYVSLGQVKKYGLRKGDAVVGAIRQPREGQDQGRQKFNAVVRIDSVNGQTVAEAMDRVDFGKLT
ncbi:MAG: transcription termination factor Rho, partial [Bacteroidota bacterium]